jgi:hypothetical protein
MADTTYTGQTLKVKIKHLSSKIIKEVLGTLSGGGVDQDFYTNAFPITTGAGVTTDDETEVDVYKADVELLDDGTDFTIVGASGKVTIKAAENQGGDAGKQITISYYTSLTVGFAQSVRLHTDRGLREVYELGDKNPQEIKEMNVHNDGEIERFWIDRNMMRVLGSDYAPGDSLPYFTIEVAPNGFTSGQPLITFSNAKFGTWDFDAAQDAIVSETSSFMALSSSVGTVP